MRFNSKGDSNSTSATGLTSERVIQLYGFDCGDEIAVTFAVKLCNSAAVIKLHELE